MARPRFRLQADRHHDRTVLQVFTGWPGGGHNAGILTFIDHPEWEALRAALVRAALDDDIILDVQELDLRG